MSLSQDGQHKAKTALPFLSLKNEAVTNQFLEHAQFITVPKDQHIGIEGTQCDIMAFVLSGCVRIYKTGETGHEITLYRIETGECCILTASCILNQDPFPAFAVAETEVEAVVIPSTVFRSWVYASAFWQNFVFGTLSKRLSTVMAVVEEVAFKQMNVRIAEFLISQLSTSGGTLTLTHQEIASNLGTSREVVSRILKDFEHRGWIALSRNQITIENVTGLEQFAKNGIR